MIGNKRKDTLELNSDVLVSSSYENLLRALCLNTSTSHVVVKESFLLALNGNKVKIIVEIIGRMPNLQILCIEFPQQEDDNAREKKSRRNRKPRRKEKKSNNSSSTSSNNSNTDDDDNNYPLLLCSALRHCSERLHKLEVSGLTFSSNNDTIVWSENDNVESNINDLSRYLGNCKQLRSIVLLNLEIKIGINASSFFHCMSCSNMPKLECVEIRLTKRGRFFVDNEIGTRNIQITGKDETMPFFYNLCTSKALKSLVLWNMELNPKQTNQICDALSGKKHISSNSIDSSNNSKKKQALRCSIKNLELWRCDLGQAFGNLLVEVLENNTELRSMIISNVPLYNTKKDCGEYTVSLMNAIKKNNKKNGVRGSKLENLKFFGNNTNRQVARAMQDKMYVNNFFGSSRNVNGRFSMISTGITASSLSTESSDNVLSEEAILMMSSNSSLKSISFLGDDDICDDFDDDGKCNEEESCIAMDAFLRQNKTILKQREKGLSAQKSNDKSSGDRCNGFIPCYGKCLLPLIHFLTGKSN